MRRWYEDGGRRTRRLLAALVVAFQTTSYSACRAEESEPPVRAQASEAHTSGAVLKIQRQISLTAPKDVAYTAGSIQDESFSPRPRAPTQAGVVRFLGSAAQNARLPAPLKKGGWSVRWSHELRSSDPPIVVLEFDGHVLMQAGSWYVIDADGREAATGSMGRSALTGDAATGAFHLVNQANQLEARSAADGELQFRWPLAFGEAFSFPLLDRTGSRVRVAGVEHELFGHPPIEPTMGVLYLLEIADEAKTDPTKLLRTVKRSETLIFHDPRMLSAFAGEKTAIATPGYLAVVSSDLQLEGVYAAPGLVPLLLSVDESGWMHVVTRKGAGQALWVVSPSGKRVVDVALNPTIGDLSAPPAIGYDRRIYLWNRSGLYALGPDGRSLWEWHATSGIDGIGVTADDSVLVGAGGELTGLDPTGKARTLHRFDGESIAGPPILAGNGDILVATKTHLHRLRPAD